MSYSGALGKSYSCGARSVAKTPYFLETISCLAVRMGGTGGSGHSSGFVGRGKEGKSRVFSERFTGRDRGVVPDQGSGLKIGDSGAVQASCPNRRLNLRIGCCFSIANQSPPQWLGQAFSSSCNISPSA